MRKSTAYAGVTFSCVIILVLLLGHAALSQGRAERELSSGMGMVKYLHLTDLCLFTEARYTRHPAMADFNTPFQDHPLALEHFPSGSLVAPPRLGNK